MLKRLLLCLLIGVALVITGCDSGSSDSGDVTLTVNVDYTGEVPIDADHMIWVAIFDDSNMNADDSLIDYKSLSSTSGTVVFTKPEGEEIDTIYCAVLLDVDGSGETDGEIEPTDGDYIWCYDDAEATAMTAIDISSSNEINADFGDSDTTEYVED